MIGENISHYRILEKLGEGGMGEVFLAEDTKLDRKAALKFLPKEYTRDKEAKERFKREAKAAAALNHPNIITIYEINEHEGQIYIAMEYVDGQTLKEHVTDKKLRIKEIIDIFTQVCEGLAKAHEGGIIHRDIKPQNIIIDKDSRVKILDFGLAKLKGISQLTKKQSTIGTIHYMSPEQILGEEVDHRTDIWSIGVVLYEILTGEMPFKGEYEQAVIYSILNEEPESITGLGAEIPVELEKIVNKSLSKNPDERYHQAYEMLADLKNYKVNLDSGIFVETKKKDIPSIAVMPFSDMSPQKDQEYFCEGMAEELINAFAKIEGLSVASRTSSFQFTGKGYDIQDVGKKLKVKTVLEGSVRKVSNKIRITVNLINTNNGYNIWSERYDRNIYDIFAIQDEIAVQIVENLKVRFMDQEKDRLIKRHTSNQNAYNLYLKGRYFWNRRYEGGMQKGIECFQRAIDEDPLFAPAYVGIADCYNILGIYGFSPPIEAYAKSKKAVQKALEIDDFFPEAYASLGMIQLWFDWDLSGSEKAFKKAIKLNPSCVSSHAWYAHYLSVVGQFDEAIKEIKRAMELDPLELIIIALVGGILYMARRYDQALLYFDKVIKIDPNFPMVYLFQGATFMAMNLWDQAINAYQKLVTLTDSSPISLGNLGSAYAIAGFKDEALQCLEKLDKIAENRYVSPYYRALIFMNLGDLDRTFELLEKAFEEKENWLIFFKVMPFVDRLRSDPRFNQLLKKIGHEI